MHLYLAYCDWGVNENTHSKDKQIGTRAHTVIGISTCGLGTGKPSMGQGLSRQDALLQLNSTTIHLE